MAISITSGTPSIADNTSTLAISWSGASTGVNYAIKLELLIGGVAIAGAESTITAAASGTSSIAISANAYDIYTKATGKSLSGLVSVRVSNYNGVGTLLSTATSASGTLTINNRHSSVSLTSPTAGQTIDLDQTVDANQRNVTLSWARPLSHPAFQARIKISMGNASSGSTTWYTPFNRYGFSGNTGTNMNLLWVIDTNYSQLFLNQIIALGASGKELKVEVISQFVDNTSSNKDLSTVATLYVAGAFTHLFFSASTIASFASFAVGVNPTVTLTPGGGTIYHKLVLSLSGWSKTVYWGSTNTGTIAFDSTDWAGILNAFATNGTSTTVSLSVYTYTDAGYTSQIGATSSSSASCTTTATVPTGLANFNIETGVAAFTVSPAYSAYTHTVNYKISTTLIKTAANGSGGAFIDTEKQTIYGTFTANQTSKTFTIEVLTYYGAKQIGATQSATATGSVTASTVTNLTSPFTLSESVTTNTALMTISKASSLFTHSIRILRGATEILPSIPGLMTGATTTYQTALTAAQQQAVFAAVTNAMTTTLTVELKTMYGAVQIGATHAVLTFTVNFPSLKPDFTIGTPTEANATNTTTYFLQSISKLNMSTSAPTFKYGASVASANMVFEGISYPITSGGGWATVTSTITGFNVSGLIITTTITDSRGEFLTVTRSVVVHPYSSPTVSYSVYRANLGGAANPIGTYLGINSIAVDAQEIPSSGGNTKNQITITVKARITGGTWYTLGTLPASPPATGANFGTLLPYTTALVYQYLTGTTPFAIENSFEVLITAQDLFSTTTPTSRILNTGSVIMSQAQNGVGIMKIRENGALDVNGDIYTNGRLRSTVATGTAPLAVDSTTVVPNLNSDLHDGYHAGNSTGQIPLSNGTVNTNLNAEKVGGSTLAQILASALSAALLAAHPVGDVYISTVNTSPATLFGGTWVAMSDAFLYGAGAKSAGATGGAETHTLTGPELAGHVHTGTTDAGGVHRHNSQGYFTFNASAGTKNSMARSIIGTDPVDSSSILDSVAHQHTFTTAVAGSNAAHNNMPPYVVVYMWKRTA